MRRADHPQMVETQGPTEPAIKEGSAYVSSLPVSFDGSCSGLQHLCAMTRAREGELVNLTPHEVPQDVYQEVADRVRARIEKNDNPFDYAFRRLWLEVGITRTTVKQDVMTYFYSRTAYGMAEAHRDEIGLEASMYFAKHVSEVIEEIVTLPAEAMKFLPKLARAVADNGKPLEWVSPVGLPWSNRYHKKKIKQVRLWLQDRQHTIKLATDFSDIDKDAAARGASPNFVHACDAAHLLRTVNAAATEGITSIATVHDCFGCLPSRAERFRKIIREQFVRMYEENDVLAQVLEQARKDLNKANTKRMPSAPPSRGSLDIKNVLEAVFAFA